MKRFLRGLPVQMAALVVINTVFAAAVLAQQDKPDPNVQAANRALQILEETAQWQQLFNGQDLSGWKGDTQGYKAEDGILVCEKGGKQLMTEQQYSDFAFSFEFKLDESGNNGIGIRVPETGHASYDGMEIQILDTTGSKYQRKVEGKDEYVTWLKPWQVHGSIYGVVPAKTGYLNPPGEWNTETIIAIEDHIMVIVNGAVIVDAFLEDVTPVDGKAHPGLYNEKGHVTLAGHSDRVEFRNLKIADYAASTPQPQVEETNQPPAGFTALFNGKDLSGWKGLAHRNAIARRALTGDDLSTAQAEADETMRAHWSVVEGILTYDGKGQSLATAKDYGDFEMYVDWKIPPGADSGIYLRGTPQVQIWDPWDARVKEGEEAPSTPEGWVNAYTNGRNLGSGGLWNNRRWRAMPLKRADKKPGEWNTFLVRMVGEKVSIWLNGTLIVDRVQLENYWDRSSPLPRADQIELQHHGSALYFKNLFIRELPY